MQSRKIDRITQHILVFGIFVIIVSSSFTLISGQNANKKPIRLAFDLWVPDLLTYVAQEKGFFKKNNVDVNLTLVKNYGDTITSYSNGDFDGIFTVFSDAIILDSSGIDTKVVYNVDSSSFADAIVGKGNNLSDVKGKKIGVDGINSFSHFFVLKSLEKVGLNEGDVEFVNIPILNVTSALQKGQIFAGHTYDPFVSDAVKKGYKILSTGADIPGIITSVLAFHSDIVQQRPQDIHNIIKSMIKAKADYEEKKELDISIISLKSRLTKDQ
jgi:NitT/TauT family transport system substrate-binding protein